MTAVAHQVTPFLTSYEVMARYHISYTTLWRRIKDGSLPQSFGSMLAAKCTLL